MERVKGMNFHRGNCWRSWQSWQARIRITNRLTHVVGSRTEDDRLATVVKVNRIKIGIRTDSGHSTSRIQSNLEVILGTQDQAEG